MLQSHKTEAGQGGLVRVALFYTSHCANCDEACAILYHVTGSYKRPIPYGVTCIACKATTIGHFRVTLCLCFKTSLHAKPFTRKTSFTCMEMNTTADLIFIWMLLNEDSFWHKGKRQSEMVYWLSLKGLTAFTSWKTSRWFWNTSAVVFGWYNILLFLRSWRFLGLGSAWIFIVFRTCPYFLRSACIYALENRFIYLTFV